MTPRSLGFALAVLSSSVFALGCDDSFDLPDAGHVDAAEPDASLAPPDAATPDLGEVIEPPLPDAGLSLSSGNISPFSEEAQAGSYLLRGRLRSSDPRPSQSTRFKLRGGFVPLTR